MVRELSCHGAVTRDLLMRLDEPIRGIMIKGQAASVQMVEPRVTFGVLLLDFTAAT